MSMYQYPQQYPQPTQGGMSSGQRNALFALCLVLALAVGFVGGIAATRLVFAGNGTSAASITTAQVPDDIATNTPTANGAKPTAPNSVAPTAETPGAPAPSVTPLPPITDNPPSSGDKSLDEQMSTFWTAWKLVEQEYYGRPIDRQKMVYGATKGMMEALGDPHTSFNDPQQTNIVSSDLKGEFGGIGVYIDARNDKALTIQSVIPGTPAERVGMLAGDIIIKVDGKDISQIPQNVVITMIKGKPGTNVVLTILRGEQPPFDLTLTREIITIPSSTGKMRDDGILYIQVTIFGDKTVEQLDQILKDNLPKQPKGIILDLRNNGGGYVVAAQQLLGRFVDEGKIALYQKYAADAAVGENGLRVIKGENNDTKTPMVVLVNGGTASASEISAGALQDYKRATLIGEKTYGKGSEQNVRQLPDGSSVRITVAHWLTPNNRDVNGVGINPDIEVKLTPEDAQAKKDPQLDRAAQFLLTGK